MHIARPLLLVLLVLIAPVVPLLVGGRELEEQIAAWFRPTQAQASTALAIVAVLAADLLLPVPSSFVSTWGGMKLSLPVAIGSSWLGLMLGAMLGFALARWLGRPLVERFTAAEELASMQALTERFGPRVLVVARAVPLMAEASVLFAGMAGLPWRRFWLPIGLANLGIALAYSLLGHYGRTGHAALYALAGSIAVPFLAAAVYRWLAPHRG